MFLWACEVAVYRCFFSPKAFWEMSSCQATGCGSGNVWKLFRCWIQPATVARCHIISRLAGRQLAASTFKSLISRAFKKRRGWARERWSVRIVNHVNVPGSSDRWVRCQAQIPGYAVVVVYPCWLLKLLLDLLWGLQLGDRHSIWTRNVFQMFLLKCCG